MRGEVDKFLDALSLRTTSADSRRTRKSHLMQFALWCEAKGLHRPRQLTRDKIQEFLSGKRLEGLSQNTLAIKAGSIRAFLRWLVDRGYLERAPHVEKPRARFDLPKALKPAQVHAMIEACHDGSPLGYRDLALLELLWGSGLRVGEAWQLDLEHLDLDAAKARVLGKGHRWREALLTPAAVDALRAYVRSYRFPGRAPYDRRAVFVSQRGKRCARNVLWAAVRKRALLAGIDHVHPHQLRHSFAVAMIENGADLRSVQLLLGHSSITSTQVYLGLSQEHLRAQLVRCHPRGACVALASPTATPTPADRTQR